MSDPLKLTLAGARATGAAEDDFKERALLFRAQRQTQIASNIANADTPNHQALDANFGDSLQEALRRAGFETPKLTATSAAHISDAGPTFVSTVSLVAQYVQPDQSSIIDGNTVDMDRERAAFVHNSILYQMAVATMSDEYTEFKAASSTPLK